ncbi:MAG: vWA domain-containing protein, partial [Planctomycetota bacterium]
FDTSARQTGEHRAKALTVLAALLTALSPDDRVCLMAVDLNAVPMTEEFAGPTSPEMIAAITRLESRIPLGSTDMEEALLGAIETFPRDATAPKHVIYVGDGQSIATGSDVTQFDKLAATLAKARVSVSSCGVGPKLDTVFLCALASRTGGWMVAVDTEGQQTPEQAGANLARAVHGTVFWPSFVQLPASVNEVFPKHMPPLRSDRDSLIIGTVKGADYADDFFSIRMTISDTKVSGELRWTAIPNYSSAGNRYLVGMVQVARHDSGYSLPFPSLPRLQRYLADLPAIVRNDVQKAQSALREGDSKTAEHLAARALFWEPDNEEAKAIHEEAAEAASAPKPAAAGEQKDMETDDPFGTAPAPRTTEKSSDKPTAQRDVSEDPFAYRGGESSKPTPSKGLPAPLLKSRPPSEADPFE